jgi:hypothetical protein
LYRGLALLCAVVALSTVVCVVATVVREFFAFVARGTVEAPLKESRFRAARHRFQYTLFFSFIGAVVGVLAGNSRTAVLGDVLPAVLALLGALAPSLFAKKGVGGDAALISGIVLAVSVLLGTILGSQVRDYQRNSQAALVYRANLVAKCVAQEQRVRDLVSLATGEAPPSVDLKCAEYPKD